VVCVTRGEKCYIDTGAPGDIPVELLTAAPLALAPPLPEIAISISRGPDAAFFALRPLPGCEAPPLPTSFRLLPAHPSG
jgi:hypothetical protein